jgi:MoxR-like ATPase
LSAGRRAFADRGPPGVGKTTLAYALARSTDCAFSRIQFTSDLLPSDVTGVAVYDENVREFVFKPGPVFANVVLADEINRATPKTQSALLEVMDRARVTVDGEPHPVGSPFLVLATQNPVDYEGTFPLPRARWTGSSCGCRWGIRGWRTNWKSCAVRAGATMRSR